MLYRRHAALSPYKAEAFADQSTVILQKLLRSEKCVSKENIMLLILIFLLKEGLQSPLFIGDSVTLYNV